MSAAFAAQAQITAGTIMYTRTVNISKDIPPERLARMKQMGIPEIMEHDFELLFDGKECFYRPALLPDDMEGGGGMGRMMMMMAGGGMETYANLEEGISVGLHEIGTETYIVRDTLEPLKWKLTNETKKILKYSCRKAIGTREITRRTMAMEDGKPVRKEVTDTVNVEAWYAEDIRVSAGPEMMVGLPGLIMEFSLDGGKVHYEATNYRKRYEKGALKEPEGTEISKEELQAKYEEYYSQFRPH